MDIVEQGKAIVDELNKKGTVNIGKFVIKNTGGMYTVYIDGENFRFIESFNFARSAVAEAIKRSL